MRTTQEAMQNQGVKKRQKYNMHPYFHQMKRKLWGLTGLE